MTLPLLIGIAAPAALIRVRRLRSVSGGKIDSEQGWIFISTMPTKAELG